MNKINQFCLFISANLFYSRLLEDKSNHFVLGIKKKKKVYLDSKEELCTKISEAHICYQWIQYCWTFRAKKKVLILMK